MPVVLLRSEMYVPTDWLAISNSTIPQMAAEIAAEAQASGVRVKKRDASGTTSYAVSAILCAEGAETDTTMAEIFEGIISSSRNVSHMCAYTLPFEVLGTRTDRSHSVSAAWPFPPYYCPFWPVRAVERYTGAFNKTLANSILVILTWFKTLYIKKISSICSMSTPLSNLLLRDGECRRRIPLSSTYA